MDGEEQHHLREVPANPTSRHRVRDPHRIAGRVYRGVFSRYVGALVLPSRHALPHRRPYGYNHFWVRRHQPRRHRGGSRKGVQGVPPGELLAVAEEEDFRSPLLDAHQSLHSGLKDLRRHCFLDSFRLSNQKHVPSPGKPKFFHFFLTRNSWSSRCNMLSIKLFISNLASIACSKYTLG